MKKENNDIFILNGCVMNSGEMFVPIKNSGFLYGDGCFETMRAYKGKIFLFEEHIARLFSTLCFFKYENINFNYLKEEIVRNIMVLLTEKKLQKKDFFIKIIISRGEYKEKFNFKTADKIIVAVFAENFSGYSKEVYEKGVKLIISSVKREEKQNNIYRHKTLNYLESAFAKNEAITKKAKEALFISDKETILEGAVSNIFLVSKNIVFTPSLDFNILSGITRKKVLKLCSKNNIKAIEGRLVLDDLFGADEVFITNSLAEILPVCGIEEYSIKSPVPGNLTKKLSLLYKKEVTSSIKK